MDKSSELQTSGFRKRRSAAPRIKGTSVSFQNAQLLISTGLATLDFHLGGGLAVGTVLLIEENQFQTYSTLLLKHFLAEGVTHGHTLLLSSGDTGPETILDDLPDIQTVEKSVSIPSNDEDLKVAWRYQNQKVVKDEVSGFSHSYDLSRKMSAEKRKNSDILTFNLIYACNNIAESTVFIDEPYLSLLNKIKSVINDGNFKTSEKNSCQNILRIAVCEIGSPMWSSDHSGNSIDIIISKFLYALRALLRSSFSVACITLSSALLQDAKLLSRIRKMSDFVIRLEPFVDSKRSQNLMFRDFDGLLKIEKLPVLNTFMYKIPTVDLAFKRKRKKFVIECLHLPPDIESTSSDNTGSLMCGSQTSLEF